MRVVGFTAGGRHFPAVGWQCWVQPFLKPDTMASAHALLLAARLPLGQPARDPVRSEGLLENFWSKGQVTGQRGVKRPQ